MASKARTESKATQRAERLEQLKRQQKAEERRRNLMVGGVVAVVLLVLVATFYFVSRSNDVDAPPAAATDYGVTIGPASAAHDVVIYEDFLCPACADFEAATAERLAALAESGQVRVDYRPFELLSQFGDYSARSTAAFGVVLQESGPEVAKEFHDLLYADQPAEGAEPYPDAEWLIDKAVEAGADEAAVRPGIEAGENDFSRGATAEARDAGVSATPTILVDGEPFTGSVEELFEAVEG